MTETGIRQKLREGFVSGEPDALTDEGLLELLFPEPVAKRLILEFGGLDGVLSCKIMLSPYTTASIPPARPLDPPQKRHELASLA